MQPRNNRPAEPTSRLARSLKALVRGGALLLACGLAVEMAAAVPLAGQRPDRSYAPPEDALPKRAFRIEPQPLTAALAEFARQARLRVIVETIVPADRVTTLLSGRHTVTEALGILLTGTGFIARFTEDGARVVRAAAPEIQTLATVEVVGKSAGRARYAAPSISSATKTETPLRDVPQSVTVITKDLIADQAMKSMADVTRYIPGVTMGQGEGNRDQPTIRGNGSTANFFTDGIRDDVQYFRDLYNADRVEGLKGANALMFGRGVGGGVLNRVSKEAGWAPIHELTVRGGSYGDRRGSIDVGQGLSSSVAARFNGVYENSNLFRRGVSLERYGLNPTLTFLAGARTTLTFGYERFHDHRTADRGLPSFAGAPAAADIRTFFGDPTLSYSNARVDAGTAVLAHSIRAGWVLRNRSRFADYGKLYQNIFPGPVNAAGTRVSLSAYNNATQRQNLFNQTELTGRWAIGPIAQTMLVGFEVGRQVTDNRRNTGYFDDIATSIEAPFATPTVSHAVTFRQSATDADNHVTNTSLSLYAQDQLVLSSHWQLIAGLRYERFDLDFHNNRNGQDLARIDHMLSPRVGLLFKPAHRVSLYSSYSVSLLPSSGDQFASLTATSTTLEPERFTSYEAGAKWDLLDHLALTASVFRLDRTNTTAPDPTDPAKLVQTGSQRTEGLELGVSGNVTAAWQIAGGYANQNAVITSRTTAAGPGATVPLVPRNTVSLWNRVQLARRWGVGVGAIYQAEMFAAIDNTVTLPSFTRIDAATYFTLNANLRMQLNLENVLDRRYYLTSNSNNNISPGSPRSFLISLTAGF